MSIAGDIARLATLVRQLQGALGGMAVVAGTTTCTFTASTVSDTVTVTHGIGRVPTVTTGSTNSNVKWAVFNKTATTFDILGRADSSVTQAIDVNWIAAG